MAKAIITMDEDDFKNLYKSGNLIGEFTYKILPDDRPLDNDEHYKLLKKNYRKAMDDLNRYAFEKLTNNNKKLTADAIRRWG